MTATLALIGNPNSGKTTLYNALTGSAKRVGNWSGVTVEYSCGECETQGQTLSIVDLPGIHTLQPSEQTALDEHIALSYLETDEADLLVNVVDATQLERQLFLTLQLLARQRPMVVVLTMMDVAKKSGIDVDAKQLAKQLGCDVLPITHGHKKENKALIKQLHQRVQTATAPTPLISHDASPASVYTCTQAIANAVIQQRARSQVTSTQRIDQLVLHRVWGLPIFLGVMYLLFLFAINVAGIFQDFFDIASDTVLVQGVAHGLTQWHAPAWLIAILASGVGKGLNTTITFIPVLGAMFFAMAFLEASGYMARAAFVMDRLMRAIGLPGKAFVPLIIGFGCNVPAIMATRTLEHRRDRILTTLMSPFMSCGARLAIFAVFVAAFFPVGGQNIVFALYVTGIAMAILTGWLLRKILLPGPPTPFVMELPRYHMPSLAALFRQTGFRLKAFVVRAGKVIVPVCMILGALNAFSIHGTVDPSDTSQYSLLSLIGQTLTPLFSPMGIHTDNWPATVGLLTGTLAKEVVVGTLNSLYMQLGHLLTGTSADFSWAAGLKAAWQTIPDNLRAFTHALGNPLLASAPLQSVHQGVFGQMVQRFDGQVGAFAYLLFVLLYVPCVSTVAVMNNELNRAWSVLSVVWSTVLAYTVAVSFYQLATLTAHPTSALVWVVSLLGLCWSLIKAIQLIGPKLPSLTPNNEIRIPLSKTKSNTVIAQSIPACAKSCNQNQCGFKQP